MEELNIDRHTRVTKALEQVNELKYRYNIPSKEAKKILSFGSDDEEDSDDERSNEEELTVDDHIDLILRRTRTIALLKIANNTAEVLPDDELDFEDEEEEYDASVDNDDEEAEAKEAEDNFSTVIPRIDTMKSFRKANSVRYDGNAGQSGEKIAALRLARTLSSFLSLPRVISYNDLEEITEKLLDESHGHDEDYADLIDCHVDSARECRSAGDAVTTDDMPIWKRRNTKAIQSLEISDDPNDLEMNMFATSSKCLLSKPSMRRLDSKGSMRSMGGLSPNGSSTRELLVKKESKRSMSSSESWRSPSAFTVTEEEDENGEAEGGEEAISSEDGTGGSMFDEEEYVKWRTEVKAEYLAWINAKIESKKRRRELQKKEAGKKPRWLLLFEASKRPDRSEVKQRRATVQ